LSSSRRTKKINHPGELLKKGDTVEVKVLDIDVEKRRISLGVKQLSDDPWPDLAASYVLGTEITECDIARILDRGMVVNLSSDVEGFIPLNQLGQTTNHPSRIYKVGDKVPAEVIEFDLEGRKIVLSIDEYFKDKQDALKEHCAAFPVKAAVEGKPAKSGKGKKADATEEKPSDEKVEKPVEVEEAAESA
jgi:small subunit ribosomal protein S1